MPEENILFTTDQFTLAKAAANQYIIRFKGSGVFKSLLDEKDTLRPIEAQTPELIEYIKKDQAKNQESSQGHAERLEQPAQSKTIIAFDFSDVRYASSRIVPTVIRVHNALTPKKGAKVILVGLDSRTRETWESTELKKSLTKKTLSFEDTLAEALVSSPAMPLPLRT